MITTHEASAFGCSLALLPSSSPSPCTSDPSSDPFIRPLLQSPEHAPQHALLLRLLRLLVYLLLAGDLGTVVALLLLLVLLLVVNAFDRLHTFGSCAGRCGCSCSRGIVVAMLLLRLLVRENSLFETVSRQGRIGLCRTRVSLEGCVFLVHILGLRAGGSFADLCHSLFAMPSSGGGCLGVAAVHSEVRYKVRL
ncbi:hypothetical protein F5B17DRAFT_70535 [Nemania serpens]|nr:hypothetical protein F5B17DRAFT_70535 [Nemania serpens]